MSGHYVETALRPWTSAERRLEADAFALATAVLSGRETILVAGTSAEASRLYARARAIMRDAFGFVSTEWVGAREISAHYAPSPAPEPAGRLIPDALAERAYELRHPVVAT